MPPDPPATPGATPGWLPRGGALPAEDWQSRHLLVRCVLLAHLPAIVGVALATHHTLVHALLVAAPLAAVLIAVSLPAPRRARGLVASLGLLYCSAALVDLAHGATVMHFHYFVAVALSALYEDWLTYLLAVSFVFIQHAVVGSIDPQLVYNGAHNPLQQAFAHAAFVTAASGAQLVFWRYAERAREREAEYRGALYDGQQSLSAQLERIENTRENLVATVSHEFRTPVTAVRAAALTLRKHRHRLDDARIDDILDGIVASAERLSRLLENMLTAAEARTPDRAEVCNVNEVATEVGMLVAATHRAPGATRARVTVAAADDVYALVERPALHQIINNLVENAIVHGSPGSQPILAAAYDGDDVVITVANEAKGVDARTLARLFEPFTQGDDSTTREHEGAGIGLYVVRRLVEVSGGSITVNSQPGWVSVEVRLPAAALPDRASPHASPHVAPAYAADVQPQNASAADVSTADASPAVPSIAEA